MSVNFIDEFFIFISVIFFLELENVKELLNHIYYKHLNNLRKISKSLLKNGYLLVYKLPILENNIYISEVM